MNVWIIEDEPIALNRLQNILQEIHANIVVVFKTDSVQELIYALENLVVPDAIFSDIQLSDGLSFTAFEKKIPSCPIIFTTAYDEYAIQAFDYNSVHYLLKPITKESVRMALDKLSKYQNHAEIIQTMVKNYLQKKQYLSKFLFKLGNKLYPVLASDVAYFLSEDKLVYAITFDNQKFISDNSLDDLESKLEPLFFFRANRQFIVNKKNIKILHQGINGKLRVEMRINSNTEITVSRDKAADIKQWILVN